MTWMAYLIFAELLGYIIFFSCFSLIFDIFFASIIMDVLPTVENMIYISKSLFFFSGLVPGQVRGMTDDKLVSAHSPESDCNSNTLDSTASNTSSVDFIQDNSDYQWCIDYG